MKRAFVMFFGLAVAAPLCGTSALASEGNTHANEGSGLDRLAEPSPGYLETLARKRYNQTNKKVSEATTGRTVDVNVVAPPKAAGNNPSHH